MHFDALTVACIAAELQRTVEGGRVQQLLAPDEHSIGMEIYAQQQRLYLLLCADPKASRVHLVQEKLRRGVDTASPLLLLLRKYVRGSQLTTVEQPDMTERLLHLHFSHPEHGQTQLAVELISQRSNLILLNHPEKTGKEAITSSGEHAGGLIMDCLRRMWASEGVQRPLMPKQPYTPPTPQGKLLPVIRIDGGSIDGGSIDGNNKGGNGRGASVTQLRVLLQAGDPLWRVLVNNFAGVSPTLAREIAWRATGAIDATAEQADVVAVAQAMQELWEMARTGQWQPGVWREAGLIVGFAPYLVHARGEFVPTDSMSMALELYYNEQRTEQRTEQRNEQRQAPKSEEQRTATPAESAVPGVDVQSDGYATLRNTVEKLLQQAEQRLQRQLSALAKDEPAPGEAESLRVQAEWLLALNSQIAPNQRTLEVALEEQTLSIPLVEGKTPVAQAEQMFDRAAKLERAAQIIPERRAKLAEDLAYLAQLSLDLTHAENQPEIATIQQELEEMGLLTMTGGQAQRQNRAKGAAKGGGQAEGQPLRYYAPEGFEIVVGRNARQNEKVTFTIAKADDLWLHARGVPGAHVLIRTGGQAVQDETLQLAAQLAAYHSKLVGERAATVIITPRRFISRAPGGRPGQVLVRQEETLTVPGTLPDLFAG